MYAKQGQPYFNSIKVRLNRRIFPVKIPLIRSFQFHKGTIKPDLSHRHMFTAQIFQFHKGTIKPCVQKQKVK